MRVRHNRITTCAVILCNVAVTERGPHEGPPIPSKPAQKWISERTHFQVANSRERLQTSCAEGVRGGSCVYSAKSPLMYSAPCVLKSASVHTQVCCTADVKRKIYARAPVAGSVFCHFGRFTAACFDLADEPIHIRHDATAPGRAGRIRMCSHSHTGSLPCIDHFTL